MPLKVNVDSIKAVMSVLFLVFSVVLLGDAITIIWG